MQRLALAQSPTPLQRLHQISDDLDAEIWVKRDDLTGLGVSGNKIRKLEFLLHEAIRTGHRAVVTCGGLQSNHVRATAVAARQVGLEPMALLRGRPPETPPDGNLLLDFLLTDSIEFCTPETYATRRHEVMESMAAKAKAFVIPEGGSNGVGALGYHRAAAELRAQAPEGFDHIVVAVGSGGTLAGLASAPPSGLLHGVAVCDDRAFFEDRVASIVDEMPEGELTSGTWDVWDDYRGPAYGVATERTWRAIRYLARREGLLLDPSYTGKAMEALLTEVEAGRLRGRILFWHTGGAFGLFGRGAELPSP